jgi:hypothetical protein
MNIANASGLFLEEPYREKLFVYVRNMLNSNRIIHDIDVSNIEPMSVISCMKEAEK